VTDIITKIAESDGLEKITTPRGDGRSMTVLTPASLQVNYDGFGAGQGADWFGPRQPMAPIAPPEIAGRAWDYPTGFNLNTVPRAYEEVGFHTLRALAENCDVLRIVIEKRKDQIARLPWTIRSAHKSAPASAAKIRELRKFFLEPERGKTFRTWIRELIEDLLVIDAPSFFVERYRDDGLSHLAGPPPGYPRELRIIDGSTLKPIIDDFGVQPKPFAYFGGTFEWLGQTVSPENFEQQGFEIRGYEMFPPVWQQILHGLPARNYSALSLIQRPRNRRPGKVFGYSPVEQVMRTVSMALRRAASQASYFNEANEPQALYSLPESWTPDQVQKFQAYWDNIFAGQLGKRRQMKFLAGGSSKSYVPIKEPPLKTEIDEWLVRIICAAFSYSPSAFISLNNRSIAEQHDKTTEEEGLASLKLWVSDLVNEIIVREFDEPDIEFAFVEEDEVDHSTQSEILTRYAESGVLTLNQVRERLGEEPDPNPAANMLMCKTMNGYVPVGKNATTNAQEGDNNNEL